jgi:hypothetical protein
MWFEDGVIINNKITYIFRFDLNGFCPNNINTHHQYKELPKELKYLINI